ncbi:MAG: tRNA (guanosine(37)-N1)-methyltransferase TrmD, partial [Patescibacteria group bacterium]
FLKHLNSLILYLLLIPLIISGGFRFSVIIIAKRIMNFHILTLFPEAVEPYLKSSILGRARTKKLIKISLVNFRKFAKDRHKVVDEKAYGGGPGMVLKVEPILKAVQNIKSKNKSKTRVILFSTRGKKLDQKTAKRLSKYENLILICGRYEGVDERVAKRIADEEISIGDYVLAGGELPALVLIEAVSRQIKGVLGKYESLEEVKGSYPVYTRPENFGKWRVPKVLLSGDHKKIEAWRRQFSGRE